MSNLVLVKYWMNLFSCTECGSENGRFYCIQTGHYYFRTLYVSSLDYFNGNYKYCIISFIQNWQKYYDKLQKTTTIDILKLKGINLYEFRGLVFIRTLPYSFLL